MQFTQEEQSILANLHRIKPYKKGTVLLKQGDALDRYFYVAKGVVRTYSLVDGEEITLDFFTEDQGVMPSFIDLNKTSSNFVVCETDCEVSIITQEIEQSAFDKIPRLKEMCRLSNEQLLIEYQAEQLRIKSSNLEQKYLHFLEQRGGLFDRVPHYQIASYLGVKPESLSRLRKKLNVASLEGV